MNDDAIPVTSQKGYSADPYWKSNSWSHWLLRESINKLGNDPATKILQWCKFTSSHTLRTDTVLFLNSFGAIRVFREWLPAIILHPNITINKLLYSILPYSSWSRPESNSPVVLLSSMKIGRRSVQRLIIFFHQKGTMRGHTQSPLLEEYFALIASVFALLINKWCGPALSCSF